MKKNAKAVILILAMLTLLGCETASVSQETYDILLAENELLQQDISSLNENVESLQEQLNEYDGSVSEKIDAVLTGSFVATFRKSLPGYTLDNTTPMYAVMTEFQGSPFMVSFAENPELLAELEGGNTYNFEIKDLAVGEITSEQFETNSISAENAFDKYKFITIVSFSEITEDEGGLNSVQLNYKKVS